MRSTASFLQARWGRFCAIALCALTVSFGATGFAPLSPQAQKLAATPKAFQTASTLSTTLAHTLLVDTKELRCLALNIYWEARSEPLEGQLAVAGVTLNRVASPRFPDSICGVVYQGGWAKRHKCQFSWQCDGLSDTPKEKTAWHAAQQLARLYLAGIYTDPTGAALWYHADYVTPYWADSMTETAQIGRHIFYVQERS